VPRERGCLSDFHSIKQETAAAGITKQRPLKPVCNQDLIGFIRQSFGLTLKFDRSSQRRDHVAGNDACQSNQQLSNAGAGRWFL